MKYLRILALVLLAALVLFTVVPAAERPVTGIQHDLEHFGAFFLPGFLFAFAFNFKTTNLLLGAAAFTLMLECIQIPLPTRHARLEDFVVDTVAIFVGVLLAHAGKNVLPLFQS
jgi:VanZ family protein